MGYERLRGHSQHRIFCKAHYNCRDTHKLEKLGAPKDQAIPWFRDNAWKEEPRRPEDDPDLYRVSNECNLIWTMIDTLTVHRIFWRFAFANADATIQGHFLGGY